MFMFMFIQTNSDYINLQSSFSNPHRGNINCLYVGLAQIQTYELNLKLYNKINLKLVKY